MAENQRSEQTIKYDQDTAQRVSSVLSEVTKAIAMEWPLRNRDGWSLRPGDPFDSVIGTALAVLLMTRFDAKTYRKDIIHGLTYLVQARKNRRKNVGGWGVQSDRESEPISTAMAVTAFTRFFQLDPEYKGSAPSDITFVEAARSGLDWLRDYVLNSWNTGSKQRNLSAYVLYWCVVALKDSQNVSRLWDPMISMTILPFAFSVIEGTQHKEGGWGDILSHVPTLPATSYMTNLLLQYSPNPEGNAVRHGLDWVAEKYKAMDFRARPPIESTSQVIRTLLDSEMSQRLFKNLEQGIGYILSCYEAPYGWRNGPNESVDMITTHAAGSALLAYRNHVSSSDRTKVGPISPD